MRLSSFKTSENIQTLEGGPDRSVLGFVVKQHILCLGQICLASNADSDQTVLKLI